MLPVAPAVLPLLRERVRFLLRTLTASLGFYLPSPRLFLFLSLLLALQLHILTLEVLNLGLDVLIMRHLPPGIPRHVEDGDQIWLHYVLEVELHFRCECYEWRVIGE